MLSAILIASVLVLLTVTVHALGLGSLLLALKRWDRPAVTRFWPTTRLLFVIAWCLIVLHMVEISIWGLFYWWWGCMPDLESALYFSGVTYSSIGYGDLLLEKPWRLFAPIEGSTGILMYGLSTGFFVAIVNRIHQWRIARGTT